MPAFDDDDDREIGNSQDGSSDEDGDETMRDADDGDGDADGDGDGDGDVDGDGDGDMDGDRDGEGEGDDDDEAESGSGGSDNEDVSGDQDASAPDPTQTMTAEQLDASRSAAMRAVIKPEMLTASTYDIVPTIAAPMSTSVNAICTTFDSRWVVTGGADGYIRKFNWVDSVNYKLALTVAQRHPFVDSVVKAGVLMSFWENWDVKPRRSGGQETSQVISPVYSLACHSQGLWLLSGTASGAIRLQGLRHDEGKEISLLQKHTSAVSVLALSSDERSLLSGSWDKTILDWDLETGQVKTSFSAGAGQVSSIEARPISSLPVPPEAGEVIITNGAPSRDDSLPNGVHSRAQSQPPSEEQIQGSPSDSLFGGDEADDDLFGDSAATVIANGGDLTDAFGEADEEMQRTMSDGPPATDAEDQIMAEDSEQLQPVQPPIPEPTQQTSESTSNTPNGITNTSPQPLANGLPHASEPDNDDSTPHATSTQNPNTTTPTSDSTFLATSHDGAIRVWDRRTPIPIARILPHNSPPWCLSATWSPCGNVIYAGRRNNTVEEYDLRSGLKQPHRTFRFPNGSGAVTSVRAMPNGRHLICASYDILRLYDLKESQSQRSTVPFLIVPGHRTGVISQLHLDPSCRFMMSTGGNRGWEGQSTEVLLGYEIGAVA